MKSWTLSFLEEWFPRMSLLSALRLRGSLIREQQGKVHENALIRLRMKRPFAGTIFLRELGSDLATFDEIVVDEVYAQVVEIVRRCQTIIDLGANIGLAALYLAHFSPSCRILAVEPNPENCEILSRNLENLVGRCELLRAAVWGKRHTLSPDDAVPKDRFSNTRVCESQGAQSGWTVEGLTMPEILARSGFATTDLLKVDIEGAEIELFSGDLSWLSNIRSIAIEFHEDSRLRSGFDEIMARYGFEICGEGRHTVIAKNLNAVSPV